MTPWGRTTGQTRDGVTTAYAWAYGGRLTAVDLTNDGTPEVTYTYGGDGSRRSRPEGGTTVRYNREADGAGMLVRTRIGSLADVLGSNPATGTYRYYFRDGHSVRALRDPGKTLVASCEFNVYGEIYHRTGSLLSEGYAGHTWDATVALLFSSPVSPTTGQSMGGGAAMGGPVPTPS